ncbi:dermonecrotic toxin domain-containing protein [Pseudomonas sp. SDO528_S397]
MTSIASNPFATRAPTVANEPPPRVLPTALINEWRTTGEARKTYLDSAQHAYLDTTLSRSGRVLAEAAVHPFKRGAPGTQVSTFAVDGAQSTDIVMVKRVPATEAGPNILLYMAGAEGGTFFEFDTEADLTAWLKAVAADPEQRANFAEHFSYPAAPTQVARVNATLARFADDDTNAVVGPYGYERDDIFTRLHKDVTVPPVHVNGLSNTRLHKIEPDGNATYIGTRADGKAVLYKYDAHGNLHGGSKDGFYFVKNGLNNQAPLILMSMSEYRATVASAALDNVGANNLRGLYEAFLDQLRNPGHGLAEALEALGIPADIAMSIEAIAKNPLTGTLLALNQGNRIGDLFGIDQKTMDTALQVIGDELQSVIPNYGMAREALGGVAGVLERVVPPQDDTAG